MGYGELEGYVKSIVNDRQNIHFIPAVAPNLIKNYTVDADIGLCVADKICLSYYYGAPNKIFEYAACGVASIVSDFPELSRFVVGEDCGWAVNPDKIELKNLILNLDEDELLIKRSNAIKAGFNYCWENEERKLLLMYKYVFNGSDNINSRKTT
jgi:glycosyltransferase involved in cell wall biosynthesis